MTSISNKPVRCAIYTRVSTDQGLDQDFNSLDAQYEASQAYIRSQAHAGWMLRGKYDDGGFSGGDTDRPALQRLLPWDGDLGHLECDVAAVAGDSAAHCRTPAAAACTGMRCSMVMRSTATDGRSAPRS
jgi:hypothetical protein